jgi:hypothetical protein
MEYPFDVKGFTEPVSCAVGSGCQAWFDRGLLQAINFNHDEAVVCFEEAIKADPSCAMVQ